MRRKLRGFALSVLVVPMGCSEPDQPRITGEFVFSGQFERRVNHYSSASPSGVTFSQDTVAVSGSVAGSFMIPEVESEWAVISLSDCAVCQVGHPSANAGRQLTGDSVVLRIGADPSFELRGRFRGDSVAGDVLTSTSATGSQNPYRVHYSGRFVAKRKP